MNTTQETDTQKVHSLKDLIRTQDNYKIVAQALIEVNAKLTCKDLSGAQEVLQKALSKLRE